MSDEHNQTKEPCSESKELALLTALTCLVRTLSHSGHLDIEKFNSELVQGRQWLDRFDHEPGHHVQAFDNVLEMLQQAF